MKLREYEKDPEFRKRAAVLEPILRARISLDRDINVGDIARELDVPLHIAGAWLGLLMLSMGLPFQIEVTGLPQ